MDKYICNYMHLLNIYGQAIIFEPAATNRVTDKFSGAGLAVTADISQGVSEGVRRAAFSFASSPPPTVSLHGTPAQLVFNSASTEYTPHNITLYPGSSQEFPLSGILRGFVLGLHPGRYICRLSDMPS
jgi:hypothetical protein